MIVLTLHESEVENVIRLAEIGKKPQHVNVKILAPIYPSLTTLYKWFYYKSLLLAVLLLLP